MMLPNRQRADFFRLSKAACADRSVNRTRARLRTTALALALVIMPFFVICMTPIARATENGLTNYPQGVDTVMPALAPAPNQTQFYNYLEYYSSNSFVNGSGKSIVPGFSETYTADALRILHTWNFAPGHFSFSSGLVPTVINLTLQAGGRSQTTTNTTDLGIEPIFVNYISTDHRLWAYTGLGVSLPTGSYKKTNFVNTGLNATIFDVDQAVTWFANSRTVASLKFVEEFAMRNPATLYHSGTTINVDYALEYSPGKPHSRFHYGIQGFASEQVSHDTIDGRIFNGGNSERAFGVGPQLRFDVPHGGFAVKYQHEFGVTNRATGDHYWFEFALPL